MRLIFIIILFCFAVNPASAACVKLKKGTSFTLTRDEPFLKVVNIIARDGTLVENRTSLKDGEEELVTTTFWNGVVAVDRQSKRNRVQQIISEDAKKLDLSKAGKTHRLPMSILFNGKEVDDGVLVIETIRKDKVKIGKCTYKVMVVRTTMERTKGRPIKEESLLSLDTKMLLGSVIMDDNWQPTGSAFFDKIAAN